MSRIVFLDTETTGLSPDGGDRIVEIGCIEMVNRRLTGETRHHYLNPERASHEDALKVHGLTEEFLAGQPKFAEVAESLLDFLAGAEIVIHNAAFDIGFLDAELRRLERPGLSQQAKVTCSLTMAREIYPGKSNSLDALCKRLEVDNAARTLHGALLDAGLLAEVYLRMTRGQNSLGIEVADATRNEADASFEAIDLAGFQLAVLLPSGVELAAHEAALADIDRASKGRTLWRAVAYSATSPGAPAGSAMPGSSS